MLVSIIVAVYKDMEALKLILTALQKQSYKNFEVVVAEDNDTMDMEQLRTEFRGLSIEHTSQEDSGIQKARSINNAIIKSSGEYLIFIDGDCVPYMNFIAAHAALCEEGRVLSGRRVNLGPNISAKIRNGTLGSDTLERNYLLYLPQMLQDGASHIEQGFAFDIEGWFYRSFLFERQKSNVNLLGCNYSCFKKDMLAMDGYDESYGETAVADDTDLQWRFEAMGLRMKSCKMAANVLHLHHGRSHREMDSSAEVARMRLRKEAGDYKAEVGITSH